MKLKDVLTEEKLRSLYENELLTDSEIANKYKNEVEDKVYQVKVSRLRGEYGIDTISKEERRVKSLPSISDKQEQLIIGGLLGDSWISSSSGRSARLHMRHSKKQSDYLRWKTSILEPYISDRGVFEVQKETDEEVYEGVSAYTYSCSLFYPYYDLFYPEPDRNRKFPSSLPDLMTPFSLAIWYMDDGSIGSNGFHPHITFGLDNNSLTLACSALRNLGLEPEVLDSKDGTKSIRFPGQSDDFFELVRSYIPECMSYKSQKKSKRREQDQNARQLKPDRAKELHNGGMTYKEIANAFDVSTSTVGRRVQKAKQGEGKVLKKMGRPKSKKYSLVSSKVKLENIEVENWSNLPPFKKKEVVREVIDTLSNTPFPYPSDTVKGGLDDQEKQREFQKLKSKDISLTEENEIRPDSLYGLSLCRLYFPNRFKARYRDNPSCYEGWHSRKHLERAVKYQLRFGSPVTPRRVRRALQINLRTPTLFKPVQAKFVCDRYANKGDLCWDPCMGYGGRLLGAISSGLNYIGTDVDKRTVEGNLNLSKDLEVNGRIEVYQEPAEDFNPPESLDLVFTSPPYWNREKYSTNGKQSFMRYKTLDEWVDGFLKPVITNSYESLKRGKFLAINIANLNENSDREKTVPLEKITFQLISDIGFSFYEKVKMPIRSRSGKNWEPIFVFQKEV